MNDIALFTINDLLEKNFFIPTYQRGYKWERKQIEDLLEDLYLFADSNSKQKDKEFYCLQPIVVKRCAKEIVDKYDLKSDFVETKIIDEEEVEEKNVWYEVVDGQQRLTTIKIILLYFIKNVFTSHSLKNECFKDLFNIRYERWEFGGHDAEKLFDNLGSDSHDASLDDNIDYDFIRNAYDYINEWFKGEFLKSRKITPSSAQTKIKSLLIETKESNSFGTVQVIWYELNEEDDSIDTFTRLNIGKIPLTNAELIKALFLQKSNFDSNKVIQRQIEIATEWDRIEYSLQNDEFWYFLNKEENTAPARIEFLFDTICEIETENDEALKKKIGDDEDRTFRFYADKIISKKQEIDSKEKEIDAITKLWEGTSDNEKGITEYFRILEEWYVNPVNYHYIGFLIYCGYSVKDIFKLYDKQSKTDFLKNLKEEISKQLRKDKISYSVDGGKYTINNLGYEKNKSKVTEKLRKFYLLLNIQYIVSQKDQSYIRFPFDKFKSKVKAWDIEHIDSYTENDMTDKDEQKQWLENCLEVIDDLKVNTELKKEIENFLKGFDDNTNKKDEFDVLKTKVIKGFNEDDEENSSELKNSVGNLTLLDAKTNRSYGNALFPFKRKEIIKRDAEGQFIPICTKYVFLKYYSKNGSSLIRWTNNDIQQYTKFIVDTLKDFLIKE